MTNYVYESKLLHLSIKENENRYISGELPLEEQLIKTDELYDHAYEAAKTSTANKFSLDSGLMQLQSKIIRQRAKSYKPDTLVFDPREFSEKLKKHFLGVVSNEDRQRKLTNQHYSMIFRKLGEESQKKMHIAPTLDFLYGTFSAEPASPVKKKRKRIEKEKLAAAVKPKTINLAENSEEKDLMMERATRTYSLLIKYIQKNGNTPVCFYEFVIDPQSFTRTIENIFTVSLLVQNGHVCICPDDQGLPYLKVMTSEDKRQRHGDQGRMQSVLSMSMEEWQTIIRKCNFTKAVIPVSRSALKATQGKS